MEDITGGHHKRDKNLKNIYNEKQRWRSECVFSQW